jgi:hypothetical protein
MCGVGSKKLFSKSVQKVPKYKKQDRKPKIFNLYPA